MRLRNLLLASLALLPACSDLQNEAREAESDGRVISNETMAAMYPESFRPGHPQYLERDFEAGADFICDELELKHGRDLCSEPEINWRE
ncbi:hypothetical protein D6201_01955 [Aurantiacibacter aquimixticola]|uniref:Uncharacterized protein n=1 Tax=Aurantiacibacter aquimixticola TaxID=1958945 RepID=A0A419RR80_9SPHN|nr:hypothetical protein D6201_01955 [Aurantiacibacter aquimixticola]